jgi:hypothetical protein
MQLISSCQRQVADQSLGCKKGRLSVPGILCSGL